MKLCLVIVPLLAGCSLFTPQVESELAKGSAAVICSLERLEIDDPELNKICDAILAAATPQQRAAAAHAVQHTRAAREAMAACPVTKP
jgi:hypothetical protein